MRSTRPLVFSIPRWDLKDPTHDNEVWDRVYGELNECDIEILPLKVEGSIEY